MAYGFGSGVRPELGATDYSNYLRGALTGAQMQAQGGAAMAAGVQNALAGVSEGIQKFQQNQQEIAAMAGDVKGMTQANPYLLESLDPKQIKVLEKIRDGESVKKKDMLEVYGAISAQNKMQQQQAAAQSQAVVDALRRAQIADMGQPKGRFYSEEEYNREAAAGKKLEGIPLPGGGYFVSAVGTYSQTPQSVINMPGADAYGSAVGRTVGEQDAAAFQLASGAPDKLLEYYRTKDLLENREINTGVFSEIKQGIDRVVADFGGKEAMQRATDTQLINAAMGSGVFRFIQSLGIGARGMDTPAERDFLREVMTGRTPLTKKALMGLTDELIRREEANIKGWNKRVKGGKLDAFFKNIGQDPSTIQIPEYQSGMFFGPIEQQAAPEIRYDGQGNAFVLDESGNVVPYNP